MPYTDSSKKDINSNNYDNSQADQLKQAFASMLHMPTPSAAPSSDSSIQSTPSASDSLANAPSPAASTSAVGNSSSPTPSVLDGLTITGQTAMVSGDGSVVPMAIINAIPSPAAGTQNNPVQPSVSPSLGGANPVAGHDKFEEFDSVIKASTDNGIKMDEKAEKTSAARNLASATGISAGTADAAQSENGAQTAAKNTPPKNSVAKNAGQGKAATSDGYSGPVLVSGETLSELSRVTGKETTPFADDSALSLPICPVRTKKNW